LGFMPVKHNRTLIRKWNMELGIGNFCLLNLITLTSCSLHVLVLNISYWREMRSYHINHSTRKHGTHTVIFILLIKEDVFI
jgi:hypothetical protein